MEFKKVDRSITSFGFIAGLAAGLAIGILFAQTKTTITEEKTGLKNKGTATEVPELDDNLKIADHLAYLGHQAEQGPII